MDIQSSKAAVSIIEKAKPELVTIGNRQIISSGRWNDNLMADYIAINGRTKWLSIGELAKVAWGQNTPTTKARARKRLSSLFAHLLVNCGQLMVVEYSPPRNRAQAVKLFDPTSEPERQALSSKLMKLLNNKELSSERYERAMVILSASEMVS